MDKIATKISSHLGVKIMIGVLGLILSFMLHELFHLLMHWGEVSHVTFFPKPDILAELSVSLPTEYDLAGEEIVAYIITFAVVLVTIMVIFKVGDDTDQRSSGQILFPEDKEMQKLDPSQMLQKSGLGGTNRTYRSRRK